jgi:hypothetical protein
MKAFLRDWVGCASGSAAYKDNVEPVTELVGRVRDQAELAGLLNSFYELHLALRSVEYINGD